MTTDQARCFALIPCGGSGTRAGLALPKQYQTLAGRPVLWHTLAALAGVGDLAGTLVAVAADDERAGALVQEFRLAYPDTPVLIATCAGATRASTVFNGLLEWQQAGAAANDWVLVHDAARCLVTSAQIAALMAACRDDPVGALLALPLADTLKQAQGERVSATLARTDKWLAQTPQMFRLGLLQRALAVHLESGFAGITDEASAVEALGLQPRLVPGNVQNFKLTYAPDFELAEAVLRSRQFSTSHPTSP